MHKPSINTSFQEENDIRKADVVMCDAAPKASGHKSQDHIILIQLIIQLSKFALQVSVVISNHQQSHLFNVEQWILYSDLKAGRDLLVQVMGRKWNWEIAEVFAALFYNG